MSDKSKACKGIDVDERGLQNVEANTVRVFSLHGFSREGHCQGQASMSDCGLLRVQKHFGRESGIKRKIGEGYHHTLDHLMVGKKPKTDLASQSYLSKTAVSEVGKGRGTSKAKVDTDVSFGGHAISLAQRTAERRYGDARFPINLDLASGTASYVTPGDGVLVTRSCGGLSVGSMTVGRRSRKRSGNFVGPLTAVFKKQQLTLDEPDCLFLRYGNRKAVMIEFERVQLDSSKVEILHMLAGQLLKFAAIFAWQGNL